MHIGEHRKHYIDCAQREGEQLSSERGCGSQLLIGFHCGCMCTCVACVCVYLYTHGLVGIYSYSQSEECKLELQNRRGFTMWKNEASSPELRHVSVWSLECRKVAISKHDHETRALKCKQNVHVEYTVIQRDVSLHFVSSWPSPEPRCNM